MRQIPTKQQMEQALAGRIGPKLKQRFADTVVAVCGLGGLGSNIAYSLARAGIGTLILIDFDQVDISNLNRQQYKACQVGMDKPQALAENLREIAPYLSVIPYSQKLTPDNLSLLAEADIICEAFDQAEEKSMLANGVLETFPEKYLVAASGMAGLGSPNTIQTRKIASHFYLCGDQTSDAAEGIGLVAPRVMLCAAHQALTVLRIIAQSESADTENHLTESKTDSSQ